MQHHRPALSWHRRFANRRGVVFLLAVYFTSLTLLILSGLAIQRTMLESRASHVSRDNAQAFYLAEAGVDQALVRSRTESLQEGQDYPLTGRLPFGQGSFHLVTKTANLRAGTSIATSRQEFLQDIVGVGSAGDVGSATVQASFLQEEPLSGVWSNALILVQGSGVEDLLATGQLNQGIARTVLVGDLNSNLGVAGSVRVLGGVDLQGNVRVGHPQEASESFETAPFRQAYQNLLGQNETTDGVVLSSGVDVESLVGIMGKLAFAVPASQLSGTASSSVSVGELSPIPNPYRDSNHYARDCGTALNLNQYGSVGTETWTEVITSGKLISLNGGNPVTLTQSRQELVRRDDAPEWTFEPASFHFFEGNGVPANSNEWYRNGEGDNPWYQQLHSISAVAPYSSSGTTQSIIVPPNYQPRDLTHGAGMTFCTPYLDLPQGDVIFHGGPATLYVTGGTIPAGSATNYALRVGGNMVALDPQGQLIQDGVHIIVTEVDGARAGRVDIAGKISGSVYAPQSVVVLKGWEDMPLGAVVGREIMLILKGRTTITGSPTAASSDSETEGARILSWTN